MDTCTATTENFGLRMRERLANNSSKANESFPPDRPTRILSSSSIRRYFTTPLLKRWPIRRINMSSSVNLAITLYQIGCKITRKE